MNDDSTVNVENRPRIKFSEIIAWVASSGKRIAVMTVVTVAGFALIIIGIAMFVTPGPGFVAILAGLGVLATEYAWARIALCKAKEHASGMAEKVKNVFK